MMNSQILEESYDEDPKPSSLFPRPDDSTFAKGANSSLCAPGSPSLSGALPIRAGIGSAPADAQSPGPTTACGRRGEAAPMGRKGERFATGRPDRTGGVRFQSG